MKRTLTKFTSPFTIKVMIDKDNAWLNDTWANIKNKIQAECHRLGSKVPYIALNGHYNDKMAEAPFWWCNGFWPGILWLLYHDTKETFYKETAQAIEERFNEALAGFVGLHHDVGFQWTLTSRLNYALTGNTEAKTHALHAATLLAGRYNPRGHFIKAWNNKPKEPDYTGYIIIDCMMNLPLLYWASEQTADPRFNYIAQEQADTALKYLVRPDGSCNHIANLNPTDGTLVDIPCGQGYASGSAWTRGASWALYGFALSYRYTNNKKYLDASRLVAHHFLAQIERYDFVSPVDFYQPETPLKLDTSAATIASCGLLTLSQLIEGEAGNLYSQGALKMLKVITKKYVNWDIKTDGIVQKSTAQYHGMTEQFEVPIIYADYFFIEAMHILKYPNFKVW